ncbi:hypothetical protein CWE15_08985 [Aliidiomarina taiwanensis]|uniref:FlgO domain-containing protein n=1 Tax=Aliidiomarina taiwanensis TaxID=946228 RepID=A0A432X0Z3_9GAMM|nr:FlgO family outer membrane protein [Aliidiomarina taiwanensis]RUO39876.1 hypothetical protein CWE15_08985 [Aliidiomarina taiwanensis]
MRRVITLFAVLASLALTACASPPPQTDYLGSSGISAGRLTPYQQTLAAQLFAQQPGLQRVAVTSFVPADSLQQGHDKYVDLAKQLQEGVLSEAHHFNIGLVEYRLTNQLFLSHQQERALSRDPQALRSEYRFDYMVVGTYSEMEQGILVNARLIQTRRATVVSAASVLVPWQAVATQTGTSQWRKGGLYRESISEETE